MIPHILKIGQRIYDAHDERWGTILLINNKEEDSKVRYGDEIILYRPYDSNGECETLAEDVYPVEDGKLFNGNMVCREINQDKLLCRYDYYCPAIQENLFEIELDKN